MSSPAPLDLNKWAKTPTGECDKLTRRSRSMHRHRGRGGQSQSRPRQEEVLIPTGHESTYRQECQREEKQCRSKTLKWHMEKWETEKQEVLTHSHSYISRHPHKIRGNLRPIDEEVWGFKVFGDNAAIYAAYILATLEWGQMYCHYRGRDTVPVLPEWLTTYIGVTKDLTTNGTYPENACMLATPTSD